MTITGTTPGHRDGGAVVPPDIYDPAVNALRFLAVDAINRAHSGHPGTPLDIAPVIYRLYTHYLRHDPADPSWFDRDRFVLSGGHASMVLYGALHLAGYDLSLDDLKTFRQLGSRCAGHPERGLAPGIEITTGPLGQGLSNAVGMALAERLLAASFNRDGFPVIDHRTVAECGDGDLMEGVTSEAASLAGHLGLGKLTVIYDDNRVSLDGPTSWTFTEEVGARFLAYGWHVVRLMDIDDLAAVDAALEEAGQETERPSIVVVHSHIGIGTPIHDDHKAHGSPVGPEYAGVARELLRWPYPPFVVPDEVYATWRSQVAERARAHAMWKDLIGAYHEAYPELAAELDRVVSGRLPDGVPERLARFEVGQRISTRVAAGKALQALAAAVPEVVGGAADVQSSTETHLDAYADVDRHHFQGRNVHFGVREHAMGAIVNGLAAHGGLRPFGATFFCFSDYMRPALRLSAVMGLPCVWVFTHDSIGLGEDGTTHQPVEQLASLRAMPAFTVIRPADANEAAQAWSVAIRRDGPTALVLSRQGLPVLDPDLVDVHGAVVAAGDAVAIIASGSEVEVALGARDLLESAHGISARVVSLASFELFFERPQAEQDAILPPGMPRVAVEAASPFGWSALAGTFVGMHRFGASGKAEDLYPYFGITPQAVAQQCLRAVAGNDAR